jgi:CheY-like chemotaxis protein
MYIALSGAYMPSASDSHDENTPRAIKLLLVEDCKSDVFLCKKLLTDGGLDDMALHITDVPRLRDAFYELDHAIFDIILLDLNLLDIDGLESVAALHAEIPHIPVIVYSGSDNAALQKQALQCGARQYLVKGRETGHSLAASIRREIGKAQSPATQARPQDAH